MFKKKQPENRVNTDGTMKWRKKTSENRRLTSMRESLLKIKSTVLTQEHADLIAACEIPAECDGGTIEDINGWLAENTVEFFNEIYMFYQMAIEENQEWFNLCHNTKETGFPMGVLYLWRENSDVKPIHLPANQYVARVFDWIDSVLNDEEIFPPEEDTPFPDDFQKFIKKMFTRLFRVYMIIRANECLREKTDKQSLKGSLCMFLYFGWHWELLALEDPKEARSINKILEPIRARYLKELSAKPSKKFSMPPVDDRQSDV